MMARPLLNQLDIVPTYCRSFAGVAIAVQLGARTQ